MAMISGKGKGVVRVESGKKNLKIVSNIGFNVAEGLGSTTRVS
jgi:hypothetical protein